nr:DUF4291 family protein [Streptomyces sp.]
MDDVPLRQAPARVQWDPERDPHLDPLPYRSLRPGPTGERNRAAGLLDEERPYPLDENLLAHLRA